MGRQPNKTIKLAVYLYRNKVRQGKEEGVVYLCSEFGKITRRKRAFDHLSDVGQKIEDLILESGLDYAPLNDANSPGRPSRAIEAPATWVCIRFPDRQTQNRGVGFLACNYAGHLFKSGDVIAPQESLGALAAEDISFTVVGRATDDQMAPFRSHAAAAVQ